MSRKRPAEDPPPSAEDDPLDRLLQVLDETVAARQSLHEQAARVQDCLRVAETLHDMLATAYLNVQGSMATALSEHGFIRQVENAAATLGIGRAGPGTPHQGQSQRCSPHATSQSHSLPCLTPSTHPLPSPRSSSHGCISLADVSRQVGTGSLHLLVNQGVIPTPPTESNGGGGGGADAASLQVIDELLAAHLTCRLKAEHPQLWGGLRRAPEATASLRAAHAALRGA